MANDASLRVDIVLSVQRALLGSITPNLRGVAVDWDDHRIRIESYYRGAISNEDKEIMSCVETEVATDFVDNRPVEIVLERLDMPLKLIGPKKVIGSEKMLENRAWVFLRKE